jgi:hypothetical protein
MLPPVPAAACAVAAAATLAACSVLPPASYPAFVDHAVAAEFVVPDGGRLRLPATTADLVVLELRAAPPPQRELFGRDGERWFVYPAGTSVRVCCRFRSYAAAGAAPLTPGAVLPDAHRIDPLEAP